MFFALMLLFIPVSLVLQHVNAPPAFIFVSAALAIVPLAEYVRRGTEEVSNHLNPSIGSLLNVTFGNMPELIIALFVLHHGGAEIVKAQITGAIIGNGLLGLGMSVVVGTWGKEFETFSPRLAARLSSLLVLSMLALLVPALFDLTERGIFGHANAGPQDERLSIGVSIVLLLVYVANLVYTLVTHRSIYARDKGEVEEKSSTVWSLRKSFTVLVSASIGTAIESEILSQALTPAAVSCGLSPLFLGLIVLAVIGNAAEYVSAVYYARKGQFSQTLRITLGSSIQLALVVAPLLVLISPLLGHPMNLVFDNPLELIAIAAVAFAVTSIVQDGETMWLEGVLLIAVYALFVLAFLFANPKENDAGHTARAHRNISVVAIPYDTAHSRVLQCSKILFSDRNS